MKKLLITIALIFSLMPAAVVDAGYYGSWKIDDYLSFTANTHTASTGAATDADAVPSYRIYEDETGTAILTGSMALLDDVNTTGLYSEQIQLTALNGLEKGKSYTIFISATVSSVAGTISHNFQIEAEVDANVVSDKTGYTASTVSDKTGYSLAADQSAVTVGTVNALGAQAKLDVNAEADTALADYDAPTNAEMEARTILAANYFDPAADTVVNVTNVATLTGHTAQTGDVYGALPTNFSDLAITATTGLVDLNGKTGFSLAADQSAVTIGTVNALTGHTAQTGDVYGALPTNFSDLAITATTGLVDLNGKTGFSLAADQSAATIGTVNTLTGHTAQTADHTANIAAILADTGELQTDWVNGGRLDLLLDGVLADTAELQADWVDAGRLDAILDAINLKVTRLR